MREGVNWMSDNVDGASLITHQGFFASNGSAPSDWLHRDTFYEIKGFGVL
jgi:hypothetical protein